VPQEQTKKSQEDKVILKMFTIRDAKAEVFNTPFFQKTHGEAERSFRSACQDEKTNIFKYPEDFDLYYLGEYDDQTGKFKPMDTPVHCVKGIECKKPLDAALN
jgi:hypothetical protein